MKSSAIARARSLVLPTSKRRLMSPGYQLGSAGRRRRLALPIVILLVVAAGALTAAQQKPYPIFKQDDFLTAMKQSGRAFEAVTSALAKNDFETAKAQLARSRERLSLTITFWRDRKKDDAVKLLRDALAKQDALDAALSVERIDPAAVSASARQVSAACEACHSVYREQDPATKAYRLKSGSVQ